MESVKTALKVFETVAAKPQIGLSELARQLGEPKTTIQRSLTTLHDAGWLRPIEGARRRWTVTTKLLTLSRTIEPEPRLREVALPVMQRLRDETAETIHLILPDGPAVVLIERLDSPQSVRAVLAVGTTAPLHLTSSGKALLAFMSASEQDAYLGGDLAGWTPTSLTSPGLVRKQLQRVQQAGYAYSIGEMDPDVNAVAAPIFNPEGQPIASMSISCPAPRLLDEKIPEYGSMVAAAAAEISRKLAE